MKLMCPSFYSSNIENENFILHWDAVSIEHLFILFQTFQLAYLAVWHLAWQCGLATILIGDNINLVCICIGSWCLPGNAMLMSD